MLMFCVVWDKTEIQILANPGLATIAAFKQPGTDS